MESVLLLDGGAVYTHSSAVLKVMAGLGMPFRLMAVAFIVPTAVRDAVYNFVARHRYRWFGRRETCRLPAPDERARFL
jgi:predicted DCC family thiol-disulfide oxidoreductase YuxK